MRAIDDEYDPAINMANLSLLDDSMLLNNLSLDQPIPSNFIRPAAERKPSEPWNIPLLTSDKDDAELWQQLMREQKRHYEEQIAKLNAEVKRLQDLVKGEQADAEKRALDVQKGKWQRVNQILSGYFDEYNVQI